MRTRKAVEGIYSRLAEVRACIDNKLLGTVVLICSL